MDSENYKTLPELLANEPDSRGFFDTLTPELQAMLLNTNLSNFETLEECASRNCYDASVSQKKKNDNDNNDEFYYYNPSCSSNDCTGLIPNGDNQTADEFDSYKDLYPFSNPPTMQI